jgi:hypothetical protein
MYYNHFTAGSGAIDAGASILPIPAGWLTNLNYDIDLDLRSESLPPDIGADEFRL